MMVVKMSMKAIIIFTIVIIRIVVVIELRVVVVIVVAIVVGSGRWQLVGGAIHTTSISTRLVYGVLRLTLV